MKGKSTIIQFALATLIGMPLIAMLIDRFSERVNLAASLIGTSPLWLQLAAGIVAGGVFAMIAHWIVSMPFMQKVNAQYASLLGNFDMNWSEILFLSLCAGIGEEILFRGAIQPFLGIFLTSVVFVAIHGYINPQNWRLSVYGLYMTAVICVLGYFAERIGLLAAIIAHTLIDVYLLYRLQQTSLQITQNDAQQSDNLTEEE
ncbi:MAG: CPBP family intramembrane metalloprotease [Crocinitomicaceae bacterium]|nr:CPBP family intramembrane metalloprotease [Crocinitomicaceae bacterium]